MDIIINVNVNVNIKTREAVPNQPIPEPSQGDAVTFTIKQISEKTSLPPHVLRYYENEGLLPGVERSRNGIRRYSENDLEWLGLICCLKNTGMSIKQIRSFVELSLEGDGTLKSRCELLREHKKNVEAQIEEMKKHLAKVTLKLRKFTSQYEAYAGKTGKPGK
jgi:DNA-binding transcriptional MerR regulator